jgi:hypothetical protein
MSIVLEWPVMCTRLRELKEAVIAYSSAFDPALLSCGDAEVVVQLALAIGHAAATIKSLAAVRSAEARSWKSDGHRSAEEHLARAAGTSVSDAREVLALGRAFHDQPDVADAARRGELSPTQAAVIADALAADPTAGAGLLDAARSGGSFAELKNRCAEVKAGAVDLEARRREIHRRRCLRTWTDSSGTWHIAGSGNPEDGAQIEAAVAPNANQAFAAARSEGRHEHPDAYRFDGLVELARQSTNAARGRPEEPAGEKRRRPRRGAPVKLLVRVDLETMMRGFPIEGETCELVGYGPVSMSAVNDLLRDGDPFVAAILTKGKQIAGVAHLGRHPTAWQKSVLEWLYPSCAAEGCPIPADHLQTDHRIDWSKTHITLLDWLDALCKHHHDLKTRDNWSLVEGIGKRPFVSPADPLHPRQIAPSAISGPTRAEEVEV